MLYCLKAAMNNTQAEKTTQKTAEKTKQKTAEQVEQGWLGYPAVKTM